MHPAKIEQSGNKIRVLHLIGSLKLGGAEKVVSILARSFNKNSCDIYILAFATGELEKECLRSRANVIIRPFQWRNSMHWLYDFVKELKRLKIDVLHTHLFTADLLGRIGGRLAGVPIVVSTIHAPSTWKRSQRLKDRLRRLADRYTANHVCDALFSISEQVSAYQVKYGGIDPTKLSSISNPIMINEYEDKKLLRNDTRAILGLNADQKVIINVASLKPVKGQTYLLQALQIVKVRHPNIRLLLVGDGDDKDTLMRVADTLGIMDNVIFLGNRLDVPALLAATDLFVMPSLSEGISIAILEAMASELPIVATSVGGNPDIIKDGVTGILVEPADAAALATAIERLLNEGDYARTLAKSAKQYVKDHHDAEMIAGQLEASYRTLYQKKFQTINCESPR